MKTIEDILKNKKITYYNCLEGFTQALRDPISFIEDYITEGDKNWSEKFSVYNSKESKNKLIHTCYIYLLGLTLYSECELLKNLIDSQMNYDSLSDEEPSKRFLYNWFLVCLFHDFGYSAVNTERFNNELFGVRGEENIRKKVQDVIEDICEESTMMPNVYNGILINYDKYKCEIRNKDKNGKFERIDHGIFSGAYFYWNRKEMFKLKKQNCDLELINFEKNIYKDKKTNLIWSTEILNKVHKEVAAMIAAHNCFFIKPDSENINHYKEYELENLIIEKHQFEIKDYPMFFLLCFVDTIDIFKFIFKKKTAVSELSYEEQLDLYRSILNTTKICVNNDEFDIELGDEYVKHSSDFFEIIKAQEYWLPINVVGNSINFNSDK